MQQDAHAQGIPPVMPAQSQSHSPERERVSPPSSDSQPSGTRRKRHQVASACENCRKRKEKCDDRRPTCGACSRRGVPCSNSGLESTAVSLRSRNTNLRQENTRLRELYKLLVTLPDEESHDILARLRMSDDPMATLASIQDANFLITNPTSHMQLQLADVRLERQDLLALRESSFRVDAKPWTVVAPDGLVSDMISAFFAWDGGFFTPFVDRESFLEDMRSKDPAGAKYCSPFLVNAICASRYYTSRRAQTFAAIAKRDMATEFLDEAKRQLDLEGGKASLPTVQGLALMFLVSCYTGQDRAGMLYRFAAYEMLTRLDLDGWFHTIKDDPSKQREREILSRTVWGLFCFESIVSYVYLQVSMISPPNIPRCFEKATVTSMQSVLNVDAGGNEHTKESRSPPMVPGILDASCNLAVMLYSSMIWNSTPENVVGSATDVAKRREQLEHVRNWSMRLPSNLREGVNFTPQTCYLRTFVNEVIISILRPLPADTAIEPNWTVRDLCLKYTVADIANMERFLEVFTFREYSCMNLCGLYNCLLLMTFHLDDPSIHPTFTRACRLLRPCSNDFPMARFVLQGIQALAWSLKFSIPAEARPYMENLGDTKESLRDVPIQYAIPDVADMRKLLVAGEPALMDEISKDMGTLLSKWSALTVD